MQITDILSQMGGLQSMARELGISDAQAASGAAALGPAILGGFRKQAEAQPTGLDGLGGYPENGRHARVNRPPRGGAPRRGQLRSESL